MNIAWIFTESIAEAPHSHGNKLRTSDRHPKRKERVHFARARGTPVLISVKVHATRSVQTELKLTVLLVRAIQSARVARKVFATTPILINATINMRPFLGVQY